MLQVFPSYQTLEIPTWALFMSPSVSPVPYSIACDAPCDRGCVMRELYLLIFALSIPTFLLVIHQLSIPPREMVQAPQPIDNAEGNQRDPFPAPKQDDCQEGPHQDRRDKRQ